MYIHCRIHIMEKHTKIEFFISNISITFGENFRNLERVFRKKSRLT